MQPAIHIESISPLLIKNAADAICRILAAGKGDSAATCSALQTLAQMLPGRSHIEICHNSFLLSPSKTIRRKKS